MAKDFSTMENSNTSPNPSIHEVSDPARRTVLAAGMGSLLGTIFAPLGAALSGCASLRAETARLGFDSVPVSVADRVIVASGYTIDIIAAWGEAVGIPGDMPNFRLDASNSPQNQAAQLGMHHDGMDFFPLEGNTRGLLAINHEYTDDGLLHADGMANWNPEKVAKSQAAHGVSVIEVALASGRWQMVRPSAFARRITASTPITISGPASGHPLLQTTADPSGRQVLGTLNNCGSGRTPWGTYLTCEENFMNYFKGAPIPSDHERRWGLKAGDPNGYRWHEFDPRFDATLHPNEPNRFGWVVEIDPLDPTSTPIKRTALGRAAHEGATVTTTRDGRAVIYCGEDARFEYIYKFVSKDRIQPGGAKANASLLDYGTLYVAKFDADGKGRWLPLTHGVGPLTQAYGFADQGEVLVKTRQASDALGATKMDRPEWIAIDHERWVYCTLTNNSHRGTDKHPAADAANPRRSNTMGHIIRWRETDDFDSLEFQWNHFVLAGEPKNSRVEAKGNVRGDAFACPDGLWVDGRGILWIQTDISTSALGKGDYANLGNNAMLAADVRSGEIRRFLVGPVGCEITGITTTPDGNAMFINIQHPGEPASERNDPTNPRKLSNWPDFDPQGRPRSATVVIRKTSGGVVGS